LPVRTGELHAFDLEKREVLWSYDLEGEQWSTPVVWQQYVYATSWGQRLHALTLSSGDDVWTRPLPGPVTATPAMAAGALYVGTENGDLIALDARTGRVLHSRRLTTGAIQASPLPLGDAVFVAALDGTVVARSCAHGATRRAGPRGREGSPRPSTPRACGPWREGPGARLLGRLGPLDRDALAAWVSRLGGDARQDAPEPAASGRPLGEQPLRDERAGRGRVALEEREELALLLPPESAEALGRDRVRREAQREHPVLVEDPGGAARHAGAEVPARRAQDDDRPARHVLAAVVAAALHDGGRARVAHADALAYAAGGEQGAGRRPVEQRGAGDPAGSLGGVAAQHDLAPGQRLADVVLRLAAHDDAHARQREGAQALARRARELEGARDVREPRVPEPLGDQPGRPRSDGPLTVVDRGGEPEVRGR